MHRRGRRNTASPPPLLDLRHCCVAAALVLLSAPGSAFAFVAPSFAGSLSRPRVDDSARGAAGPRASPQLWAAVSSDRKLSKLPVGISPFEKSASKTIDVQADFRKRAHSAVEAAAGDGVRLLEVEFPPLIGGDQSKSQFDDFDNVQELDKNKDWSIQFAPMFSGKEYGGGRKWLVFPDLKECEIAKKEWMGARYQESTFTTIEAATNFLRGEGSYDAPWGANLVSGVSKIMGGKDGKGDAGLMGDQGALDPLVDGENSPPALVLVIQPGNGGPVEDWINCEKIFDASSQATTMVVINGALDKLRGGYYAKVFFPKLASSVERFFTRFESAFYLKPISDKGVYGWLFRVYPEPWQVVLQTASSKNDRLTIEDTVVYVSDERPTYNDAVAKLVTAATE